MSISQINTIQGQVVNGITSVKRTIVRTIVLEMHFNLHRKTSLKLITHGVVKLAGPHWPQ